MDHNPKTYWDNAFEIAKDDGVWSPDQSAALQRIINEIQIAVSMTVMNVRQ